MSVSSGTSAVFVPRLRWLTIAWLASCSHAAPESTSAPRGQCPPCPEGFHCAADVMVREADGKTVCYPTYCVAGPDLICTLDPAACSTSPGVAATK